MSKNLKLSNGGYTIIDNIDYELVKNYKWYKIKKRNTWYARTCIQKKCVYIHRLIMNHPEGMMIDHLDGNALNNRRNNLRICTVGQNNRNTRKRKGGTSKYKGVSWCKEKMKWVAHIKVNYKSKNMGCFNNEIEAAEAYNKAALLHFGDYAYINKL